MQWINRDWLWFSQIREEPQPGCPSWSSIRLLCEKSWPPIPVKPALRSEIGKLSVYKCWHQISNLSTTEQKDLFVSPGSGWDININRRRHRYLAISGEKRLLHIMCGYQCDKAVNKNHTREVIWCHFTECNDIISLHGFKLSNQMDCDNLVGLIGLHVIF